MSDANRALLLMFPFRHSASRSAEHPTFPGALPAVWNIPYPHSPYFTGREEVLHRLAASLRAEETVNISQPQAVHGLGGVGKTQIALEYAYRYYQDYDAVLWVWSVPSPACQQTICPLY